MLLIHDQMVILFCFVASGSVTNFFPTVVQTLGYNNIISLLLTCPPYVCPSTRLTRAYTNFDLGSLRDNHLLERLACRQDWRTVLPHHTSAARRSHRLYYCGNDDKGWTEVLGHDAHGPRRLHRLCRGAGVDLQHPATSASQTRCGLGSHQRGL